MPIDAHSRLPASIALRRAKGLELAASGSTGSRVFSQGVEVLSGMRQCVAEQGKVATLLKAGWAESRQIHNFAGLQQFFAVKGGFRQPEAGLGAKAFKRWQIGNCLDAAQRAALAWRFAICLSQVPRRPAWPLSVRGAAR
ncbi:hypothetical protein ACFSKY_12440 [Azotobacter chroococcum]|uniref:hypothetical protein n=1 Tax=Azotobacter chroococcum TaxID=353 RepID=UPI0010409FC8|nr:hypothetical protein [Azotobacter chroococcum]TBV93465.1 hypothetical protein E0E53_16310 [Azotobacter chroococcum]